MKKILVALAMLTMIGCQQSTKPEKSTAQSVEQPVTQTTRTTLEGKAVAGGEPVNFTVEESTTTRSDGTEVLGVDVQFSPSQSQQK